jgi:hypothetical protein
VLSSNHAKQVDSVPDQQPTSDATRAALIPDEAVRLQGIARQDDVTLRIAGSVAVHLSCPDWREYLSAMGRRALYDIDYWAKSQDQKKLEVLFAGQGYQADPKVKHMHEWGVKRLIFEHPETGIKIDVFMDELVMAHTIKFRDRLDKIDGPTVSICDLLLSKLQIHEITANDLMDLAVMLGEHDLAGPRSAGEDLAHLEAVLGADWGFWFEACSNLDGVTGAIEQYQALGHEQRAVVRDRAADLRARIEGCKKTSAWKRRSWLGTKTRWYELVSEVNRDHTLYRT